MKNIAIATIAALAIFPTLAMAKTHDFEPSNIQFNGPVTVDNVDVLIKNSSMFTEDDIVLEGNLLRQISEDKFIFSDGSGEIVVEIDDDVHVTSPINQSTKVRLFGEFEGGRKPEVEVERLVII